MGTWWPARALMFGRYATDWVGPRRASRFGLSAAGLAVPAGGAGVGRQVQHGGPGETVPLTGRVLCLLALVLVALLAAVAHAGEPRRGWTTWTA